MLVTMGIILPIPRSRQVTRVTTWQSPDFTHQVPRLVRPENRHASSYHKAQAGLPECKSGLPGTEQAEFKGTQGPWPPPSKQSPQILGVIAAKKPWPARLPGQSAKGGKGLREQPWPHRARSPGVRALPVPRWRADGRGCQGDTCQ